MNTMININKVYKNEGSRVLISPMTSFMLSQEGVLSKPQQAFLTKAFEKKEMLCSVFFDGEKAFISIIVDEKKPHNQVIELFRKAGSEAYLKIEEMGLPEVLIDAPQLDPLCVEAVLEGMLLSAYKGDVYKSKGRTASKIETIQIINNTISEPSLERIKLICGVINECRDLINAPLSHLDSEQLGEWFMDEGTKAGLKVEVFNKARISALKMGGLLSVNRGSAKEPSFSVFEWKPSNALNVKPVVLIGKGIVFDTGGISLKPSASMEEMKSDMAGGALVFSVMKLLSLLKIPLYVVGLVPATDNHPGENAMVPGDVITIYGGKTVEVLNTDAEGRLILADALSYSSHYDPELVIDFATLTGSARMTLGKYAIGAMQKDARQWMDLLLHLGFVTHERLVEFPLWDDMAEVLDSDIADVKNIGGKNAGMMTAGHFLSKFIDASWIHLDIAPVAYSDTKDYYLPKGATGFGIRLMLRFLEAYADVIQEQK